MQSRAPQSSILWRQVWGLSALLAAIIFSWIAYDFYQPKILTKIGFVSIASTLGILQGLLGAIIEPCVGGISDRVMQKVGSRLPVIATGVTLAGLIFVAVAMLMQGDLSIALRWLIPVLMTFWVIAMIVFRSPAIALLMQLAPTAELPKANTILVIVFGGVSALGPLIGKIIQQIGASLTFLLGAVVLLVGALLLWSTHPQYQLTPIRESPQSSPTLLRLGLLFGVGFGAGFEVNILLKLFPPTLHSQLPSISTEYVASGILLLSALASPALERLIKILGVNGSMLNSLGAIVGFMGLSLWIPNKVLALGVMLVLGIAFGLLFTAQIPFALSILSPTHAGLATGLYFGGIGAAMAVVSSLELARKINPIIGLGGGAIAFLIAASCLIAILRTD